MPCCRRLKDLPPAQPYDVERAGGGCAVVLASRHLNKGFISARRLRIGEAVKIGTRHR